MQQGQAGLARHHNDRIEPDGVLSSKIGVKVLGRRDSGLAHPSPNSCGNSAKRKWIKSPIYTHFTPQGSRKYESTLSGFRVCAHLLVTTASIARSMSSTRTFVATTSPALASLGIPHRTSDQQQNGTGSWLVS